MNTNKKTQDSYAEDIYVYDFDKTIYDGDVTYDFYKYCFKKFWKVKLYFVFQVWAMIKYLLGFYKWTKFKEKIFGYLKQIDDIDLVLEEFWAEHKKKIKKWYLNKNHSKDVIISASPEFLLKKICCEDLKVKLLIGTKADKKTGEITGKNCYGSQKVKRLNQEIEKYNMREFYSDSLSDEPLAKLADNSYIVLKDELIDWQEYKLPKANKFKLLFFSRDFILFILIGIINTFNGVFFSCLFKLINLSSVAAFCSGFVFGTFIAYLLNNYIIFKERFSWIRYFKFFISYIPNFLIQLIVVFVMCNIFKLYHLIAYLTAAVIGVPVSFLFVKLFAFKPTKNPKADLNSYYLYKEE